MNDLTPCVVWTKESGYSAVLSYASAKKLAHEYANQGFQTHVFQLKEVLYYGGRTV